MRSEWRRKERMGTVSLTHMATPAAAGLGLPIIGALLGHTQASTTQRYAHLQQDPLKAAAELIKQHKNCMPEIMIPVVAMVQEIEHQVIKPRLGARGPFLQLNLDDVIEQL